MRYLPTIVANNEMECAEFYVGQTAVRSTIIALPLPYGEDWCAAIVDSADSYGALVQWPPVLFILGHVHSRSFLQT